MMTRVTLRNLTAHKLRLLLTAVSVVLGVAMVAATFIYVDTMSKRFDDLVNRIDKNVAVDVRGRLSVSNNDAHMSSRPPVPATIIEWLRQVDGARRVTGDVLGYANVLGRNGKSAAVRYAPQLGEGWVDGGDYALKSGRAPHGPLEMVVDEATMKRAGYRLGDQARIQVQGPTRTMTIVGVVDAGNLMGASYAAFDTATAQRLLLKPGYFSDITIEAEEGVSERVLRDRVARTLPGTMEAITGTQLRDEIKDGFAKMLTFLQTLLLVFALIAVFVGAFIIFNTFSMLVAQRTRELALLRAIGASRRQVTRAVLGEALGVALVGSTIGLAAGTGLAVALQKLMSDDSQNPGGLVFTARPVLWSYAIGLTVTVIAAYFPARRAAKVPPVAAMRDDVALPQRSLRRRVAVGTVMTVLGAAILAAGIAGLSGRPLVLLGVGAVMVFLGVTMLAPMISKPVIRLLGGVYPLLFGTPGRLARENALRNPRRTSTTAAALMIGLALVSMINVISSSAVASIGKSVDEQFGADYMLMGQSQTGFSPQAVTAARRAPGVERATALYYGYININGKPSAVEAGEMTGLAAGSKLAMVSGSAQPGVDGMLVDEDMARSRHWSVGAVVAAQFPDGVRRQLRIAGIYRKNDLLGPRVLAEEAYLPHVTTPLAIMGLVQVKTADTATRQAIERALHDGYPNVTVEDRSGVKKSYQKQLDQIVALFTILLAMSIIIAAMGVINTLALSVIERTREIGLLRAVGTSRRQVRRMVRLESVVIALFGALLGVAIGVSFGAAIQNGLQDKGLTVLDIPVGMFAIYVVLGGLIGTLAALWPAWRAGRMDVLKAIATE